MDTSIIVLAYIYSLGETVSAHSTRSALRSANSRHCTIELGGAHLLDLFVRRDNELLLRVVM